MINDKETLIVHTPIFNLVEGEEIEQGFKPVRIRSKDWVSIIVEKDGKFLMVKQLRHGLNKEFEEFPCGMIEDDDIDAVEAGLRELQEETGIVICDNRNVQYFGKYAANPAFMTNYMHYLYVNLDNTLYDTCATSFDEHEHIVSYWVNKKTAYENFLKSNGSAIMGTAWMLLTKNGIIE